MQCHRCMTRHNTCCSRGLRLSRRLRRSQGRLLQRGRLMLGRLLAGGQPGSSMLGMLLLLQLILLLLLLLVRIDLQCARRPLKGAHRPCRCTV